MYAPVISTNIFFVLLRENRDVVVGELRRGRINYRNPINGVQLNERSLAAELQTTFHLRQLDMHQTLDYKDSFFFCFEQRR